VNELIDKIMNDRGLSDETLRADFLNPDYSKLHDPFLLKGMAVSVKRIVKALKKKEHIIIYADYDCDGIPSSVLLYDFFTSIGHENISVYIPDRMKEGYGLHIEALDNLALEYPKALMVTVDLGIRNVEQVAHAKSIGFDIIVTDHHIPGEILPLADAIINPMQKDCDYPFSFLCGAGVAFKLVCALQETLKDTEYALDKGQEKWLLDMVGLATLSDMVPLVDENRIFAYFGMLVLKKGKRDSVRALAEESKLKLNTATEEDIAFTIVPRLNAPGRMTHPRESFELLISSGDTSKLKAKELDALNTKRKNLVTKIVKNAKSRLKKRDIGKVIVIGDREWPAGVLGLIAQKITEEYDVPSFVWGTEIDGEFKGSCRAPRDIHLVKLMEKCSDSFVHFGGHKGAGGFSVSENAVHTLEEVLSENISFAVEIEKEDERSIYILPLEYVHRDFVNQLRAMAPFGVGNEKPLFQCSGHIHRVDTFGKTKNHASLFVKNSTGNIVKVISFFADDNVLNQKEGDEISFLAHIEESHFMGRSEVRLSLVKIL
jgi:single-stranded-DNA-specific exonuclease